MSFQERVASLVLLKSSRRVFPLVAFMIGVSCCNSFATDYFVSPSGNASWSQCTIESVTCSAVTAMNNAEAGDTVYFRGGIYLLTGDPANSTYTGPSTFQGWLQPANSGTDGAYITFKAYPGETPIMDAAEQGSDSKKGRAFGTNGKDYIVFDGFKLICKGGLLAGGIAITAHDSGGSSDHCIIRNCEFDGGSQSIGFFGDNVEGIRAELVDYLLIENCLFYNYSTEMEASGANTGAFKAYDTDHITITNCEFKNSSAGIYWKRNNKNMVASYNYIHNVYWPIKISAGGAGPGDAINAKIFHNVIVNYTVSPNFFGKLGYFIHGFEYYNNTVYSSVVNSSHSCELRINDTDDGVYIYNNIFGGAGVYSMLSGTSGTSFSEFDHNTYLSFKPIYVRLYAADQKSFSSLSAWQASGELLSGVNLGEGSIDTELSSVFVNSSGQLNQLNDFLLKPDSLCKGSGRGGGDMGANIAMVGYQVGGSPARPAAPVDFVWENNI
ncbi:MAG: hypothetical protein D3903_02670 [Candidatus Electrothrix sp. GM3_4]|nr:hypothetical protein [Candidatus Electrothrix sp. GM3_4]